jgi:chromosomal replication initiator protein
MNAPPFPVATIQRIVAHAYGINECLMTQPCQRWSVSRPRQVAMYLARRETGKSYRCLSRLFGGLDHSVIRRASTIVEQRMAMDPSYRADVEALQEALR